MNESTSSGQLIRVTGAVGLMRPEVVDSIVLTMRFLTVGSVGENNKTGNRAISPPLFSLNEVSSFILNNFDIYSLLTTQTNTDLINAHVAHGHI